MPTVRAAEGSDTFDNYDSVGQQVIYLYDLFDRFMFDLIYSLNLWLEIFHVVLLKS